MNRPIRILVFAEFGWCNGGENSWLSCAKFLKEFGFEFKVACPLPSELSQRLEQNGIQAIEWKVRSDGGDRKPQQQIRAEIEEIIATIRPHILHANSLSTSRLLGPVSQKLSIPSVGYLRDILKLSRKAIDDINCCTRIVAVSDATRTFHIAQGLSADKCKVIHNGVDLETFRPRRMTGLLHNELSLAGDTKLMLCIGQIGLRKATDVVIEAFLKLQVEFPQIALAIIGMRNSEKEESIEFENRCRKMSAQGPVHWLGRRNDVHRIMNEAVLLIHGAKQEPLGRVLLESLASGLPFIATSVGGTSEIVDASCEPESLLCEPGDAREIFSLASKLLTSPSQLARIGKSFRRRAEDAFDICSAAEKLGKVYRELDHKT